jgi:hypothetical protein
MEPTLVRDLDAVRRRRAELHESIAMLQTAIADAIESPVVWGERVQQEVARLALDFVEHIDVTEGVGGLHETIVESAPRLRRKVDHLTAEHDEIELDIAELAQAAEAPVMARDVEAIKVKATLLLDRLIKHRQRGADLVYEAFEQDLGAGD